MKLLSTNIWAYKKLAALWQISLYIKKKMKLFRNITIYISILIFKSQFRIPLKNLKSERNNPWFKQWFNSLLQLQLTLAARR